MIGQNVLLELAEGDKVQVYVNTASGLFDHKNSHYTQVTSTKTLVVTLLTLQGHLVMSCTKPIKNKTVYLCYFILLRNASENGKLITVFVFFLANFY